MERKKILIIDDDVRNIYALGAVLRARSYDCVSCQSAEDALRLLEDSNQFDAILIDMMMPDMDGYEAIPLIKKMPGHDKTLVVSVTAQAMVGDREKCLHAGADDYISKPVDVDKLLAVLQKI